MKGPAERPPALPGGRRSDDTPDDDGDGVHPVLVAADAATTASRDAAGVSLAAAGMADAVHDLAEQVAAAESMTGHAAGLLVAASASAVADSSAQTVIASDTAVASTTRSAQLAQRRAALLPQAPKVVELRGALDRAELRLHYQPMFRLASGDVVAVEALLRWQHPTRGLLPPAEFLDVAEGPYLLMPVGDWVLKTAVGQAAQWQQQLGERAPTVWVNISCDQLGRRHLPDLVRRLLARTDLPPGGLGIEVTERQLATRIDDVEADLSALRDLGVVLSVDDFGTGYASLDYLRRFAFDEIKIDRSFVSGLGRDRTDTAVTASIIALGQSLELSVVAEGVETEDQYERLKRLGCSLAQGYLLARPGPPEAVTEHLLTGAARLRRR